MQRSTVIETIESTQRWDMVVIGGGITGAGIAREAARRQIKVLLVEQRDFAWGTSSRSSKMVHGGLRYMAAGDIKTTRQSVRERERLLKEATGLVTETPYLMAHYKKKFPPPFLFNMLLMVYDFFSGKRYRHFIERQKLVKKVPQLRQDNLTSATRFADALTDDSRLVMRVLDAAVKDGATVINYVKASQLLKDDAGKVTGVALQDELSDSQWQVNAKVVVNATGAWADNLRQQALPSAHPEVKIRPSRGSHIVIPTHRLPLHYVFTMMHPKDGRALFVYPWENTIVIGTTDIDHPLLDNQEVGITQSEFDYLLQACNYLFPDADIGVEDVISTWAGVRPLISAKGGDSTQKITPSQEKRSHSVWCDNNLITVSGGKLTTFRLIALDVLKACQSALAMKIWDDQAPVLSHQYPEDNRFYTCITDGKQQTRLIGRYGDKVMTLVHMNRVQDFEPVGESLTLWSELIYSARHEMVVHLDDLLLRRTRLGILLPNGALGHQSRIRVICQTNLGWDTEKWQQELERYQQIWRDYYYLPKQQY